MILSMGVLAENLACIQKRMNDACRRVDRDKGSVKLVAVTKQKSSEAMREAYLAGQRVFGENYAQELRDKIREFDSADLEWHFIGHLQRNKAKYVAPYVKLVHTVDSKDLADALDRRAESGLDCLIEINVGGEYSKSGTGEGNFIEIARHIESLSNLRLRGLMTIPPYYDEDPEKSRIYFKKLRGMLKKLNAEIEPSAPFTELSMGMSHDFEVAIEEGATIVRIGTAIFGER